MDKKVRDLMNDQINKELYSAYLYLDFANYYEEMGLKGFANWFTVQTQEERDHAMLLLQYLQKKGEHVELEPIAKPDVKLESALGVLQASLAHEQYVTGLINDIYAAAYEAKDFATMQFLDWFVKEQVEEEDNATTNIQKMEMFGNDSRGLYLLDQELGARVSAAPSLTV